MWYASGYLHRFHCINTSCKTPAIMKLNLVNLVIPQLQLFRSEVAVYGVAICIGSESPFTRGVQIEKIIFIKNLQFSGGFRGGKGGANAPPLAASNVFLST